MSDQSQHKHDTGTQNHTIQGGLLALFGLDVPPVRHGLLQDFLRHEFTDDCAVVLTLGEPAVAGEDMRGAALAVLLQAAHLNSLQVPAGSQALVVVADADLLDHFTHVVQLEPRRERES